MGLNTEQARTSKTYVTLIGGQFAVKADEKTPNAVKRFSEKKKCDVWELLYGSLTGRITNIETKDGNFGKELHVTINDVGDVFQIQIPVDSRYFYHFAVKIGNVDLANEVMIAPYSFEDKEKKNSKTGEPMKISGINFYQPAIKDKNNKIPYFDFKDKPERREDMSEKEFKIFKIEEDEYLLNYINNFKIVTAEDVQNEMNYSSTANQKRNVPSSATIEDLTDDLPFLKSENRHVATFISRKGKMVGCDKDNAMAVPQIA